MSIELIPFDFEGRQVRVVTNTQGEPLFVAADVLAVLTLDRKALERLDDDEKGVNSIHTPGGAQDMSGLHAFVGEDFFDALTGHDEVKAAYDRWQDTSSAWPCRRSCPSGSDTACCRH